MNFWLRTVLSNVHSLFSKGRGVSKQIQSRVSDPSVQNLKEMPIINTFHVVTRTGHQATINRYSIIIPVQGNLTGKGLVRSPFYVISGFRPEREFKSHEEKLFEFLGK